MTLRAWLFTLLGTVVVSALGSSTVGAQWVTNGVKLANEFGGQDHPTMVADGQGGAIVSWIDWRSGGADLDVYAQRIDASGRVLWADIGVKISHGALNQLFPRAAIDGASGAIITWYDNRSGTNYDIYARRVNASGIALWTNDGVPICTAVDHQTDPRITADGFGGAVIAWLDHRTLSGYRVYAQAVDASGITSWTSNGIPLDTLGGSVPDICSDGAGGAIVVWWRDGIRVQRVNGAGVPQWASNGVSLSVGSGGSFAVIPAAGGGAIVTWQDNRNGNYDIFAQRVNSSGVAQWSANGVPVCLATGAQQFPTIAPDDSGGVIVAWEDARSGPLDIYARRVDANGNPRGAVDGDPLCTAAGDQFDPHIVADGAHGAIVVWTDRRTEPSPYGDVYAQRINLGGVPQWATNGVAVCTAADRQFDPALVGDGVGGALVSWDDFRDNTDRYIYAMRVAPQGGTFVTGVEGGGEQRAGSVSLFQNRPNPFNPDTRIEYEVGGDTRVRLSIYDISGRLVARVAHSVVAKGRHAAAWSGRNQVGDEVASGVYIYRLESDGFATSRRMVLLR